MLDLEVQTVKMTMICYKKLLDYRKSEKRSSLRDLLNKKLQLKALNLNKKRRKNLTVTLIAMMITRTKRD